MKTLGLIGGMSWQLTAIYYRLLNEIVRERLGGLHSAELLLYSFDFAAIAAHQSAGDWDAAARLLADVARRLEGAGAEGLLICTNTMHRMADEVQAAVSIPLIHIADATAGTMKRAGRRSRRCSPPPSPWNRISTRAGWRAGTAWPRSFPTRKAAPWSTASSMRNCAVAW